MPSKILQEFSEIPINIRLAPVIPSGIFARLMFTGEILEEISKRVSAEFLKATHGRTSGCFWWFVDAFFENVLERFPNEIEWFTYLVNSFQNLWKTPAWNYEGINVGIAFYGRVFGGLFAETHGLENIF